MITLKKDRELAQKMSKNNRSGKISREKQRVKRAQSHTQGKDSRERSVGYHFTREQPQGMYVPLSSWQLKARKSNGMVHRMVYSDSRLITTLIIPAILIYSAIFYAYGAGDSRQETYNPQPHPDIFDRSIALETRVERRGLELYVK